MDAAANHIAARLDKTPDDIGRIWFLPLVHEHGRLSLSEDPDIVKGSIGIPNGDSCAWKSRDDMRIKNALFLIQNKRPGSLDPCLRRNIQPDDRIPDPSRRVHEQLLGNFLQRSAPFGGVGPFLRRKGERLRRRGGTFQPDGSPNFSRRGLPARPTAQNYSQEYPKKTGLTGHFAGIPNGRRRPV